MVFKKRKKVLVKGVVLKGKLQAEQLFLIMKIDSRSLY